MSLRDNVDPTTSTVFGPIYKVTAEEFRKHCEERVKYHTMRADKKEKEDLPTLEKLLKDMENPQTKAMSNYNSSSRFNRDDAVDQMKEEIKNQRQRASKFKFIADHLAGTTYFFTQTELIDLEFIAR
jgi:hypothetical protein